MSAVVAGILCLLIFLGYRILTISAGSSGTPKPLPPSLFSFADVLSFFMAVLGVMIALASLIVTAVGVGIAILAVVGYQTFKTEAANRAREVAIAVAEEYLKSPDFDDRLKDRVQPSRDVPQSA